MSRPHDKEDYSEGKQVDDIALVSLAINDLRSHVPRGANLSAVEARAIATGQRARKAEVNDLDIIVLVDKEVLRLEVTVGETFRMDVAKTKEHLLEVVLADGFRQWAGVNDVVEELTTSDHLLLDVSDVLL